MDCFLGANPRPRREGRSQRQGCVVALKLGILWQQGIFDSKRIERLGELEKVYGVWGLGLRVSGFSGFGVLGLRVLGFSGFSAFRGGSCVRFRGCHSRM